MTYLDNETLVTWPRDEVRGVVLTSTVDLRAAKTMRLEVSAEENRTWRLEIYADNHKLLSRLIEGSAVQTISQTLPAAGPRTVVRLFQHTLVGERLPSSAHWRRIMIGPAAPGR